MGKVVIITGGTSGIGQAVVRLLRAKGCRVYELSRRAADADSMHFSVDVTVASAVKAAVDTVAAAEGRVDLVINNAGMGISGAMEFTDPADAHRLMEVNLFGMDNVIRAALPHMRAAGGGRIVNISSVAGVFAIPFQAWYSISKAAVRSLTMATMIVTILPIVMIVATEYKFRQRQLSDSLWAVAARSGAYEAAAATVFHALGDDSIAFYWLETAFRQNQPHLRYLDGDPRYESLARDSRFAALMQRVGVRR